MWVLGRFSDLAATEKVFYKGRPATWSTTVRSRSVAGPGGDEASLGSSANYLPVETVSVQNCTVPG